MADDPKTVNPIDAVLNSHQDNEISRPESVPAFGFEVKGDDIAHNPDGTSQEHSLDDTHAELTPSSDEKDILAEVAQAEIEREDREE